MYMTLQTAADSPVDKHSRQAGTRRRPCILPGLALCFAIWLAGCTVLSPSYVHRDGVRPGTVTQIGSDPTIVERLADTCPPPDAKARYALIRYTGNDHLRWRAFPLPPEIEIGVGDRVLLDVNACRFTKME